MTISKIKEALENIQSEVRTTKEKIDVDYSGAPAQSDEEFNTSICLDDIKEVESLLSRSYYLLTGIQAIGKYK